MQRGCLHRFFFVSLRLTLHIGTIVVENGITPMVRDVGDCFLYSTRYRLQLVQLHHNEFAARHSRSHPTYNDGNLVERWRDSMNISTFQLDRWLDFFFRIFIEIYYFLMPANARGFSVSIMRNEFHAQVFFRVVGTIL